MKFFNFFHSAINEQIAAAVPETVTLPKTSAISFADYAQMFLGLIAVVGLIFICAWLLRKVNYFPMKNNQSAMQIVSSLNLGTKEKILLLQVRDKELVIGVSGQGIQALAKFEHQEQQQTHQFQQQLNQAMEGNAS